ncbi:MAG: hypothetical protein IPP51_01095 [Bacteroidetes bacterium]|nr:hypothetical protein [Bacteroidota bacterium]
MIQPTVKAGIVTVFVLFFLYGLFLPHYPVVNADELWETSRGYYLKAEHKPGEPLLPESVAPFYSSIGNMGWKSWCMLLAKSGTFAAMMTILPVDELSAMRYGMFLWSVLLLFMTYLLARRFGLQKWPSLLVVAMIMFLPDFFAQIHRERSEILIGACLMVGLWLFMKALDAETPAKKNLWYFITGIYSWTPALWIHPSAILIPGVIGVLYLIFERKNFISLNTVLIGIGLAAGCFFFLFIMNAIKEFAVAAGGGNYFQYQGPPILTKGWKFFLGLPYGFYNRFISTNLFTRPISFLFYVTALWFLIRQFRGKKLMLEQRSFIISGVAVIVSLLVLYFLSGSFGNYNVIIAPFMAIAIVSFIYNDQFKASLQKSLPIVILLVLFAANLPGFAADGRYAKEYTRMTTRVREKIDHQSAVLGLALYYNPFKDQPYYSNSWFNPYGGRIEQSFEQACDTLNVKYIIVDDAFVGRALLDRGRGWTDSMFTMLQTRGEVIDSFPANYFVGNRVPGPDFFPSYWKYEGQQKQFIRQVKIYKLKE